MTGICQDAEPFALQVLDDSMAPELHKGCVVIVDPGGELRPGKMVLVEYAGEFYVRRVRTLDEGRYTLDALAPGFPEFLDVPSPAIQGVVTQRAGVRRRYHKNYD